MKLFISFLDFSLLAYRKTSEFCILILYAASLLNLLALFDFWWFSVGFSIYKITSFGIRDRFMSSFPIWMPFISPSCLIALAGTSSAVLNTSGETGHSWFLNVS